MGLVQTQRKCSQMENGNATSNEEQRKGNYVGYKTTEKSTWWWGWGPCLVKKHTVHRLGVWKNPIDGEDAGTCISMPGCKIQLLLASHMKSWNSMCWAHPFQIWLGACLDLLAPALLAKSGHTAKPRVSETSIGILQDVSVRRKNMTFYKQPTKISTRIKEVLTLLHALHQNQVACMWQAKQ